MIELERHIEILLLRHDCVIVPDFGGFMTHHVEARYDENERFFLPPLRTVGFNPQLKMNDSLLVQSYIEVYDISYPEALRRIEDEVDELRQRLSNEGSYELRNIGTLFMSEAGTYVFEPCEAGILTPCLYGLGGYEFPLLTDQHEEVVPEASLRESGEPAKQVDNTHNGLQSMLGVDEEEDDHRFIRLRVSVVRNIAAACIALIVFFAASTPLGDSSSNVMQGKLNTSILDKLMTLEKKSEVRTAKAALVPVAKDVAKPQHKETAVKAAPKQYYCIVLASKVSRKNAEIFVEKLKANGHHQARVLTGHGATKVVYGHFDSESDAYNKLNAYSDQNDFAEGWVLHVNEK